MNYRLAANGVLVVARKDIRIYYRKAPVFIFGLILPTFLFFAFFVGRELDIPRYFPGFLAMSLFFTSSSVGPLIVPWEKQAGTFERLLSMPVSVATVVIGDALAGALFGLLISSIIGGLGIALLGLTVTNAVLLMALFFVGNLCFAALGVLLSSFGGRVPANIMMLAALVRFPLIFISGIFIPLSDMTAPGIYISYLSPLTYLVDGLNAAMGQAPFFPWIVSLSVLLGFTALFLFGAVAVLGRNTMKGL
jgi:ABC-2 type transport system permease protein